jgi:hypothetical protein
MLIWQTLISRSLTTLICYTIDSYINLTMTYRVIVGSEKNNIGWNALSERSFEKVFVSTLRKFEKEKSFGKKCRVLLDLFKLQVMYAGIIYD